MARGYGNQNAAGRFAANGARVSFGAAAAAGSPPNSGNRGNAPISPLEDLMRRKGVDEAWVALAEMQRTGLPSDRFTISRMLMKTLADGRRQLDSAKVYRSIALVERFVEQQPEEADEVLFNAILDTYSRMKDTAKLEITFQQMKELKVEPSHVTLGILVKAYGQACDFKQVMRLWDEMAEQRSQANVVTYGCMINACVKCGQTEKAAEIFRDLKRRKKHINTILYTTLIKGYGNEKDLHNALMLFNEMDEEGVPYNTIAFNSIIDVCIKCNDMQTAENIFRQMIASSANGSAHPDLITYSTLLKGYCQVGDLDKALQVAETIKACGMKCDDLVYNTLMDGCVKANDLSAGVGLFAEMTQSGMKPSSITHSIFLRLYQRNGYKGSASDAVAQLYQHHGVEQPQRSTFDKAGERGFKGAARRGDKQRQRRQTGATAHASSWELGLAPQQVPESTGYYGGAMPANRNAQLHNAYQQPPQACLLGQESFLMAEAANGIQGQMQQYMAHCGDAAMRAVPQCMSSMPSAPSGRRADPLYGIASSPQTFNGVNIDRMPTVYQAPQSYCAPAAPMMSPWSAQHHQYVYDQVNSVPAQHAQHTIVNDKSGILSGMTIPLEAATTGTYTSIDTPLSGRSVDFVDAPCQVPLIALESERGLASVR